MGRHRCSGNTRVRSEVLEFGVYPLPTAGTWQLWLRLSTATLDGQKLLAAARSVDNESLTHAVLWIPVVSKYSIPSKAEMGYSRTGVRFGAHFCSSRGWYHGASAAL